MTILFTIVLSILSILQAAGGELKQGVFYDEMEKPPVVWLAEQQLHVRTTNSMRNSSLAICSSDISVENGEITEHWDAVQPIHGSMRFLFWMIGGKFRNNNTYF